MGQNNSSNGLANTGYRFEVREQLNRILAEPEFRAAPQLAAFLEHIVVRKLEGAENRIKAYTIATEALGRPPTFNSQDDTIVRVQAGRLRRALEAYYAGSPAGASVAISLPVGTYIPEFKALDRPESEATLPRPAWPRAKWRRIGPFAGAIVIAAHVMLLGAIVYQIEARHQPLPTNRPVMGQESAGLTSVMVSTSNERDIPSWFSTYEFKLGLEHALSRFAEVEVLSDPAAGDPKTAAQYILELSFKGGASAVIGTAQLKTGPQGLIAWSQTFSVPEGPIDQYDSLGPVRKIASVLAQPYGVLYSQLMIDPAKTPNQACMLQHYEWYQHMLPEGIQPALECLDEIVSRNPENQLATVMLAYMYSERFRAGSGDNPAADLDRAFLLAKRAIALRPDNASSYQILMQVYSDRGMTDLAMQAGRKAVELNPNNSDVLADFGCRLIYLTRYAEGMGYVKQSYQLNSERPPIWQEFCLFVALHNTNQLADAEQVADRMMDGKGIEGLITCAIAEGRKGKLEQAAKDLRELVRLEPAFATDPATALAAYGLGPEAAGPIVASLDLAGLKVVK